MALVETRNLGRVFIQGGKSTNALQNLTLDVPRGDVFGILGPNGAGKTTLINILGGVLTPSEGYASIFGLDVTKHMNEIVNRINICSGDTQFHWALRTRQILNFYGRVYGFDASQRSRRIDYLTEKFEIKDLRDKKFGWFSSGQRMRVILCKALMNEPEFLMMDEPTLRLDPDIAKKTRDLVREINRDLGVTILLASHYMSEVEELCHRIGFLWKGKLVDVGDIEKVKNRHFSSFKVRIKLVALNGHSLTELEPRGFQVNHAEGVVTKELTSESELSGLIESLIHGGYNVLDIRTQRPTLEDCFLKMVGEKGLELEETQENATGRGV